MRPRPKGRRNGERIDSLLVPPGVFIAAPMEFAMMEPANRNGELVADLPPHRALLGKFDVMGVRWASPADEARLGGYESQMVAIPFACWLADGVDPLAAAAVRYGTLNLPLQCRIAELAELGRECALDHLGVCRRQLVFEGKDAMCPKGKRIRISYPLKLREQLPPKLTGGFR